MGEPKLRGAGSDVNRDHHFEGSVISSFRRRFPDVAQSLADRVEQGEPVPFGQLLAHPRDCEAFDWA